MKVQDSIRGLRRNTVFATGFFDGVHRGHQALLEKAASTADGSNGEAWLLSFDRHPASVVRPGFAPELLVPRKRIPQLVEPHGITGCIFLPFNEEFSAIPAQDFLQWLVRGTPGLHAIVCGPNWKFGKGAAGNVDLLLSAGTGLGFETIVVEPVLADEELVSSSLIRKLVREGAVAHAARLLSRPHRVEGNVMPGRQAGRTMGFPTANIRPQQAVIPAPGIYAAFGEVDGERIPGSVYIGEYDPGLVEIHLLGYDREVYGRDLIIHFIERIRSDLRIPDRNQLARQIAADVKACSDLLATLKQP